MTHNILVFMAGFLAVLLGYLSAKIQDYIIKCAINQRRVDPSLLQDGVKSIFNEELLKHYATDNDLHVFKSSNGEINIKEYSPEGTTK